MTWIRWAVLAVGAMAGVSAIAATAAERQAGVRLMGTDFAGGGQERFGSAQLGEPQTNYVYARPTGPLSSMKAKFSLGKPPAGPVFLHIRGRDDDGLGQCGIEVKLNGKVLLEGPNKFPSENWQTQRIAISEGVLKAGDNELVISNRETAGVAGQPPWFMVAWCAVGGEGVEIRRDITKDFFVTLPSQKRPFPEPLADAKPGQPERPRQNTADTAVAHESSRGGQSPPYDTAVARGGFKIRGIKGWNWTPEQYLEEVPVLARYKMNFLMNCYLSMFSGHPKWENNWWEPIPEVRKRAYEKVIKTCREHRIEFCFALHPQLGSSRPINPSSDEDFEKLWPHFEWAQNAGAKWFCVPLDDVHVMQGVRIDGSEHARMINKLLGRLRARDPQSQLIFCPTWYWGDGTGKEQRPYLEALARDLHPDVYLFWTGDAVVGRITRKAADTFRGLAQHRIVLWDNYPVNDGSQTLHLGPVTGRDPDLCEVVDGYMSNPLCPQNQINRIPMLTCADYSYSPAGYDPERSIGQAILQLADTPEQRAVLKDLVEAYPGMLMYEQGTGFNPVRHQYARLASAPHSRYMVEAYVRHMAGIVELLEKAFPDKFQDARKTVAADVAWMKQSLVAKYGR